MACEPGCPCCSTDTGNAVLVVTINPEGRVEAARTDVALDPARPGEWASVAVAVINQGYVTGPLQLRWSTLPGVEVDAPDTELTGAPRQDTRFRVRLTRPGGADLTLRFWALGSLGGLANKNTAFLYLRCRADDASGREPAAETVRTPATN
ncbi:hypothetical protein [Microlunatus speluncae]|uniref:hypothetical protein n=1 Tax=Microlunatus speluncae TaxID=2594267 RepID=UPI0012663AEA|nr:hypothetical protein [Microlunatus speluncae]